MESSCLADTEKMRVAPAENMVVKQNGQISERRFRRLLRASYLLMLALLPFKTAAAADFRAMDLAFSNALHVSASRPDYHATRLRQLATDAGLTSEKELFEGLNARQSIAQALDQLATSSFEMQIESGKPPKPDDLQILANVLATLGSLEKAEANTGLLNDLKRIRASVFSLFVVPLIDRPARKALKPLADQQAGVLLAQFLGGISGGGVRVLDLYAEPASYSLTWSPKAFSTPVPALRTIASRAYFSDYSPRKDGLLGLAIDVGSFGERERNDLFAQFEELQRGGLIVIIDDTVARLNSCIETAVELAERTSRDQEAGTATPSARGAKKSPRSETSAGAELAPLTSVETAEIKRRCQAKVQTSSLSSRAVLFDPKRSVLVSNFSSSSAESLPLRSILADARYAIERWP